MKARPIEIFCGTGGVGKTTLASSRALYLASQELKVLLITIDPAKRLKQALKMDEGPPGKINSIKSTLFNNFSKENFSFDALLMNPASTMKRITEMSDDSKGLDNPIINIITRPYGGMNEIMAILEVQYQLSTDYYDTIILDTPPGKHFLDFLQSTQKISQFFDKSFVDIFKYLGKGLKKVSKNETRGGMISLLVKTGIKKLLKYLEKVTGESFVNQFIDAVLALYNNRDTFLKALKFQENLKDKNYCNWFLTTSVEQQKMFEAVDIKDQAIAFMHSDVFLLINKCLRDKLDQWSIPKGSEQLQNLRDSMLDRENRIKEFSNLHFESSLEFSEVFTASPIDHVSELAKNWHGRINH